MLFGEKSRRQAFGFQRGQDLWVRNMASGILWSLTLTAIYRFFAHLHQRNKANRLPRLATLNGATGRVTRSGAQIEACYTAIGSRHQECSRSAGGQHLECRPGGGGGEGGTPVGAGTIQRLSQGFGQGLGNNVAG